MTVIYKGHEIPINDKLLVEQKATENLYNIIQIRYFIHNLFEAEKGGEFVGSESEIMEKLTELEYDLQDCWNFPKDKWWHLRQFRLSRCLCGYTDNKERAGVGSFIINGSCPYHGVK